MKRWLVFFLAQGALLIIELATRYDTTVRQYALSLSNVAAVIGLWLLDRWLQRRGQRLSIMTLCLAFGAVWLDALGNFQHLYAGYWWYDRLAHTTGGLAISAIFIDLAHSLWARRGWANSGWFPTWFGFLLGQFAAAMYEVSEWLGDWWFDTERVRGIFDSPRDLFFNLVGGLVIVFWFRLTKAKK